jgi:hypothetical protein
MAHFLYIDIETLPAGPEVEVPPVKAPANYKDPEKIAAYIEEHREEAYRATSLDPLLGRLLAVGVALDEGDPIVFYNESGTGEIALLNALEAQVTEWEKACHGPLHWVGHNIEGFDLRWLYYRACRYACFSLSRSIPWLPFQRPYRIDTMALAGGPTRERVSLAKLAAYFYGITEKSDTGITGAQVYQAWLDGRHEEIRAYCADDVKLARKLHYTLDLHAIHERGAR